MDKIKHIGLINRPRLIFLWAIGCGAGYTSIILLALFLAYLGFGKVLSFVLAVPIGISLMVFTWVFLGLFRSPAPPKSVENQSQE